MRVKFRALDFCAMGRANQRPRKSKGRPVHHEHLPKVSSGAEAEDSGRLERSAVMDVMGLGNASRATRTLVSIVGVLLVMAAIAALIILTFL